MEFHDAPIPEFDRFPDVEAVQIVAYYRLIKYRRFIDSLAGTENRFWRVHRTPTFAGTILSFQIQESPGLEVFG
jgi:hypothetical protein